MPRLLVVDDKVKTRRAVYRGLMSVHDLVFAATAHDGRAMLRRDTADLVLLDAELPDRPGLSFLADLLAVHRTIPVIVLARRGSEALCAAAFRAGARDYFSDPLDAGSLARAIRRIVARGAPAIAGKANGAPIPAAPPQPGASFPAAPPQQGRPTYPAPPRAASIRAAPERPGADPRVVSALEYVREHFHEPLTLGAVARRVGLGKFTLSHRFAELAEVSFRTFLGRIRVEKAKELLGNPEWAMPIVAERAGFGDISRFNKLFRKYAEVTPSAYRRSLRARNAQKRARSA
jgi:YesN/AraC family two-component response regulator